MSLLRWVPNPRRKPAVPDRFLAPCLTCGRRVFIEVFFDAQLCLRRATRSATDADSFAVLAGAKVFSMPHDLHSIMICNVLTAAVLRRRNPFCPKSRAQPH